MISHVPDQTTDIIRLAAKLSTQGPDAVTLRKLATQAELLAMRLEAIDDARLVPTSIPKVLYRGSYCRTIRKRYKLTQADVAHFAGLDDRCVRDMESNKHDPRLGTMLRLSFALKTPASKLWPALNAVPASAEVIG